jgi:hypothetical protein
VIAALPMQEQLDLVVLDACPTSRNTTWTMRF